MNILYVEDDPRDADLTRREFARSVPHFRLDSVATQREALARLEGEPGYDLVLTDLRLPDGDGLSLLAQVRERGLPLAVVVITGGGDEESAVAALKAGANDYVVKGGDYLARLPLALENALHRFRAEADRRTHPLHVLYAEHHASDVDLTRRHLARQAPHIHLEVVHSATEVFQRLSEEDHCDLLLLDYHLPGMNALEVLKELAQVHKLDLPVVLVTGRGDEEVAVQALRLGAADYLVKNPGYLYRLPPVLENAFHRVQLAREQAALRESEEHYRTLFDGVPTGLNRTTPAGQFIDANLALVEMLGYPDRETLLATDVVDTYADAEDRKQWQALMEDEGVVRGFETRMRRHDGAIICVESNAHAARDADGRVLHYEGSLKDITERKQAEDALQEYSERLEEMVDERTQELRDAQEQLVRQEKLAVLGHLAGAMAHELRNPLGAISNAAYFLNMVTEEPEPEVKEMLEIMEKEVRTSERIISSLLDFAHPKPPIRRIVDVNEVVRETLSRAAVPDNVELVRQLEEPLPTILADPDQLVQVFGNLILNAVQAMTLPTAAGTPEGGALTVRTALDRGMGGERDTGTGRQGDDLPISPSPCLRVSISDTGEGISEENMGKIFEPLFTTRAKGIGLGLPLAKMLAEANGGSIEVQSEVGKGSTFTVKLPAREA